MSIPVQISGLDSCRMTMPGSMKERITGTAAQRRCWLDFWHCMAWDRYPISTLPLGLEIARHLRLLVSMFLSSSLMLELGVNACPRLCLEDFESNYTLYSGEIFWLMLKGQQSCFRQITCFLRTEHEYILVVLSVRSHVPRAGCRECQRSRARWL